MELGTSQHTDREWARTGSPQFSTSHAGRVSVPTADHAEGVARRDPLHADEYFRALPEWNESQNLFAISRAVRAILPSGFQVSTMDVSDCLASIRDLGMLASSLARHGVNPTQVVRGLEECLLELGQRVDMIPRDTVYHYGIWNPTGARERRFTSDPAEQVLIEAARLAAPGIDGGLDMLLQAVQLDFDDPEFARLCRASAKRLQVILCSVGKAKAGIPPEFFARTLRPYFAELELGGERYGGASAAPLSVCMFDHVLWGSDSDDEIFRAFQTKQIAYNLPSWRSLHADTLGAPSLVTRLFHSHLRGHRHPEALAAVLEILHVLIVFRGRHRFVASRAYNAEIRQFDTGSGGYGVDTLNHLLQNIRQVSKRLRSLLDGCDENSTGGQTCPVTM